MSSRGAATTERGVTRLCRRSRHASGDGVRGCLNRAASHTVSRRHRTVCRSIKVLRQPEGGPSEQELYEAALQYVRKISGFRKPARVNQEAFDAAVLEITAASRVLLERLHVPKR